MTIDKRGKDTLIQASGLFVAEDNLPAFLENEDDHPLCLFANANSELRKNIVLYSPEEVEGLVAINNKRIITINVPQLGFDKEADPSRKSPLIVAAMGLVCQTSTQGSISARDAFSDCFFLGEDNHLAHNIFQRGDKPLPENCFSDHEDGLEGAISRPAEGPLYVYRFPKCIPRLLGTFLEEGSIRSKSVQGHLQSYHPAATAWMGIHMDISKASSRLVSVDAIKRLCEEALPPNPGRSTILKSRETTIYPLLDGSKHPGSLKCMLMQRIQMVIDRNKKDFFELHPDLEEAPAMSSRLGSGHSKSSASTPLLEEEEDELLHKKHARAIASWRLLLAIKNSEGEIVLPPLTERFLQCFEDTKQGNARTFRSSIRDWMKDRQGDNRDYFLRKIEKIPLNYATCKFFLDCSFHVTSLDEDKTDLDHSISLLTFLPVDTDSDTYSAFCSKMKDEELDDDLEDSEEKKKKKYTKTYTTGKQERSVHVMTALANFDAVAAFAVDCDNKSQSCTPIIVNFMRKFADLMETSDFRTFESKFLPDNPWIPHNLLCMAQNLLAEAASVADSTRNVNLAKAEKAVTSTTYDKLYMIFEGYVQDITRCCTLNQVGCFQQPARSYVDSNNANKTKNPKRKQPGNGQENASPKNGDGRDNGSSKNKRGWFTATGRFRWPETLTCAPCIKFGLQGSICNFGSNCQFEHKIFPRHFSETDKNIIVKFEKDSDTFHFTQAIRDMVGDKNKSSSPNAQENEEHKNKKVKKDADGNKNAPAIKVENEQKSQ